MYIAQARVKYANSIRNNYKSKVAQLKSAVMLVLIIGFFFFFLKEI